MLVAAGAGGSRLVDHRISSYASGAHVLRHAHDAKEQIYHFLEGEGLLELGDAKHVVRPGDYAFIPPTCRMRWRTPACNGWCSW